ncbi:iron-dependent peroxidase [Paenibacillus sp. FSL M8-0334]|uniref:Iron-dependent peroxidase n=1 Tax=Paenibacillus campinasensis TaxID=66347 RepID=A0ABW9T6A4_9BACL|nr:iron-dependent peroxidase [Paenibacillus campinasensis]MUG68860.1 iron-dependent peroxidase [Paenibacillus campinasensis]
MNYVWDVLMRARSLKLADKDIRFVPATTYSPYMELSLSDLNATKPEQTVEVNPYYRFYSIFRDLFGPGVEEHAELRETLFDLLIHFLAEADLYQGMNRREYYIGFMKRDLAEGIFGVQNGMRFARLELTEQDYVAENLLSLYETGEAVHLFRKTMRQLFPHSIIYANCEEKDELLIYVGREESEGSRLRVGLIMDLFLPARLHTEIYWSRHFGIMDQDSTMRMDEIALY